MIEQQYYTRERGGLFNQTDGYDTVAKSPQLRLDYIKKNLHPLCSYDIPYALQKSGEPDENKYPPNFMIVPLESGETIVGQAIYKSKDFTRLRSTFFMHNFILSEKERRRYIKEPEKLFGITGFASAYDSSEGRQLPTLAAIPYEVSPLFRDRQRLLDALGISYEVFLKLVAACFTVAHSKKKIFIVLNVPFEYLGEYAKALLYHVYTLLPWGIAERLGVSTYSGKAEPRKNIQITFIDQEALQSASRISKEYIFDFVGQRIAGCEEQVENETYMRIALPYTANKIAWEKYNQLADELAGTMKNSSECDLAFYGRVALLFEMHLFMRGGKPYDLAGSKERKGLLKQLMIYCKDKLADEVSDEMEELMEYSIGLLHEPINRGLLWDEEEVKAVLQYKLQYKEGSRDHFTHCEQIMLCLLTEATKEKQYAYVDEVLRQARYFLGFYQQLIEACFEDTFLRKHIIYRQVDNSILQVSSVEALMSVMEKWEVVESILLKDGHYRDVVLSCFESVMIKGSSKLQLLSVVQRWCKRHEGILYEEICELYEGYFLSSVNLEQEIPDEKTLLALKFAHQYPEENDEIIRRYQELKTDISAMSPRKLHINMKVQELIKKFYKQNPKREDFYLIVYAFLGRRKQDGEVLLQLKRVLNYLKDIHHDLMFDFIIWSKGQEVYMDKSKFDSQVVSFFVEQKEKKEKIPKDEIKERLGSQVKTQLLAEKILKAQKPAFIRFLDKNKGGVILICSLLIVTTAIGTGAYIYIGTQEKKALEANFQQQVISPEAVLALTKHFSFYDEGLEEKIKETFGSKDEKEDQLGPVVTQEDQDEDEAKETKQEKGPEEKSNKDKEE